MANIAFLGAGMMGQPIIQNFLRGGHAVKVYNRTLAKAKPLEALGAVLAATPREAASGVDAIFSSVINDDASRAVWTGTDGALQAELQPGAYAIEMSTVSLTWVSELKDLATGRGLHFMPMLDAISKSVMHVGGVGSGITFKLIYNVMGAIQVAACAEGMQACEAAGIDIRVAAEGFSTGATGSPHVARHSQYMAENSHEDPVQFSGRNRIKDLAYGIDLIENVGGQSEIGHAAKQVFEQMVEQGMGDLNDSELIDALRKVHTQSGE
jgi:3-hydroxyisobutyrate dehydrogenase